MPFIGQGIRAVPGQGTSTAPTIYNVVSPGIPNTEFSQALSADTKQFLIRNRANNDLKIAFTATESGTKFVTLKSSAVLSITNVTLTSVTIYMQTPGTNETVEILEWV